MPTYSGGLGVLAGDTIRAAADLRLPMVAVSLLYRKGYFRQRLLEDGTQVEEPVEWRVEDFLHEEEARVSVPLENRRVELRCWRYPVKGVHGFEVPVYFLDAEMECNAECDRNLTGTLYGGDAYYRLCQEVLLGIGGVRMLRELGYTELTRYHMNEGHAALLSLELLGEEAEKAGRASIRGEDIAKVREKCVFTTHTPVPAGHDRFPVEFLTRAFPEQEGFLDLQDASSADLLKRVLQAEQTFPGLQEAAKRGASLNMTYLALSLSTYVNGVAKLHGETSRKMFPEVKIDPVLAYGNSGRNLIIGPGYANLDSSLFKKFNIRETQHLEFRLEFFNVLNRTNFLNPVNAANSSWTSGGILTQNLPARIGQVALKYAF